MSLDYNLTPFPREPISLAAEWLSQDKQLCLATLVNIEGSAPYPVGTQMLIDEQGCYYGQITGGCAEQAIAEQGRRCIKQRQSEQHRYGINSPFFDIKLPCGSGIDVHFDVDIKADKVSKLRVAQQRRITVHEPVTANFSKTYRPTSRLVIAGQGELLLILAKLALQTGFDVACLVQSQVQNNHQQLKLSPLHTCDALHLSGLDKHTAFVSLFHEHDLEIPLLDAALNSGAFYIGALGSRKTHSNRIQSLRELKNSKTKIDRIHGPVGLDIHASTPSHIAVSILAELIANENAARALSATA